MIIGIDLGTTNSLVAYWDCGEAKIIPNALGESLTPSVISIDNDDSILIGTPALYRMAAFPEKTVVNFKRSMGSEKNFNLGPYNFRAEDLSSIILTRLKEDAEKHLGCTVEEAVISVPAYFSDVQRKAVKVAAKLAGLHVERLINEPTAAGIAYGLQDEIEDVNYLIFDLGGGTFDVSILTQYSGIIEVRASSGDSVLGGIDFTEILTNKFEEQFKNKFGDTNESMPIMLKQKIRDQADIAKHYLSINHEALMKLEWQDEIYECLVSLEEFEQLAESLLDRIRRIVQKVLSDAKLSSKQIAKIVLVGGATRMSIVKRLVAKMFGKLPLSHINPDTVVAKGAAIQAALKQNDKALEEIVVTDVCPYSLGVAVGRFDQRGEVSEAFDPIIERNSIIPISRSRVYFPLYPNQKAIHIKIYQGENFFVDKNILLGNLVVPLDSHLKDPAIDVRFTYDINGLIEIEAVVKETQKKSSLIIEGNPGVLTEQQIKERLIQLQAVKIHPREQSENILLISKAEKLFVDLHGEARQYLANSLNEFLNILESQDISKIARARTQFQIVLSNLQTHIMTV